MRKVILSICFITFAFVFIGYFVHRTPMGQIDPKEPIEFFKDLVTTPRDKLGVWFFNNIVSPVFKGLAFPVEMSFEYIVKFGSQVVVFFKNLFEGDLLGMLTSFFEDVRNFFDGIFDFFGKLPNFIKGYK